MKMPLKRFATAILAVCLLGMSGFVYAGGSRSQPQPQPKPQPQPQPKPQPKPVQQKTSPSVPVIGSLSSGSSIGSLSSGSGIGSLSSGSAIGSLSSGSAIGSLIPQNNTKMPVINDLTPKKPKPDRRGKGVDAVDYLDVPADEPAQQSVKAAQPEIRQAAQQAVQQAESMAPQIKQAAQQVESMAPQIKQAAQQAVNAPAVQQIVQENPQLNEPIVITPRSVRAGNASSGSNRNNYGAGYSGGNGSGPLIYNP